MPDLAVTLEVAGLLKPGGDYVAVHVHDDHYLLWGEDLAMEVARKKADELAEERSLVVRDEPPVRVDRDGYVSLFYPVSVQLKPYEGWHYYNA